MPITYKYDKEKNLLKTFVADLFTTKDILEHFKNILADGSILPGYIEIVDLDKAEDFDMKYSDILVIRSMVQEVKSKGHGIVIICAFNKLSQEIADMMSFLFQRQKLLTISLARTPDELDKYLSLFSK